MPLVSRSHWLRALLCQILFIKQWVTTRIPVQIMLKFEVYRHIFPISFLSSHLRQFSLQTPLKLSVVNHTLIYSLPPPILSEGMWVLLMNVPKSKRRKEVED